MAHIVAYSWVCALLTSDLIERCHDTGHDTHYNSLLLMEDCQYSGKSNHIKRNQLWSDSCQFLSQVIYRLTTSWLLTQGQVQKKICVLSVMLCSHVVNHNSIYRQVMVLRSLDEGTFRKNEVQIPVLTFDFHVMLWLHFFKPRHRRYTYTKLRSCSVDFLGGGPTGVPFLGPEELKNCISVYFRPINCTKKALYITNQPNMTLFPDDFHHANFILFPPTRQSFQG